jgi:hypothetical protein
MPMCSEHVRILIRMIALFVIGVPAVGVVLGTGIFWAASWLIESL